MSGAAWNASSVRDPLCSGCYCPGRCATWSVVCSPGSDSCLRVNVAFLIFRRPDLTERVFQAIADAKPARLFVVADGPRSDHPEDASRVSAARAGIQKANWPYEVLCDCVNRNVSCGVRDAETWREIMPRTRQQRAGPRACG